MKNVKTRPSERTPRTLSVYARAPKELARRSILSAKEKAQEVAQRQQPQGEQPEQYAENRVERTAEEAAHRVGQDGKALFQKANDAQKQRREAQKQHSDAGGTDESRSSFSSETNRTAPQPHAPSEGNSVSHTESNAVRQGRQRVAETAQSNRRAAQGLRRSAQQGAEVGQKAVKTTAKSTVKTGVKTAQKSVKTAQQTVKAVDKTVKTAQQTAKAAQKTAQATAKAAQAAARAAQAAAKAAVAAAKAAAKAVAVIIKWIIAAVKALVAAIVAGGWVAALIVVVAALISALLLIFGVFSANDSVDGSKPMTEAIQTINAGFQSGMQNRIAELTGQTDADMVEVICEGDMESLESSVPNWADVIGVYAIRTGADEESPADVTVVTPENVEKLTEVFYGMNTVSYRTEAETETITVTDEYGAIVLDENGDPVTAEKTTLYIYVNISSMDYRDGAALYRFTDSQNEMLTELMRPDYYPLIAELIGATVGDGGEYGFGLNINPDLPESELGAQIVQAAKRYIGRSYSVMDCSGLVRAAYRDAGLSSMNSLNSAGMARKCQELGVLFTDPSQLQSGDIIFFSRKDPSRGPGYCTDHRRCGTGRCKRWLQIHHVAIYINGEFLIDSTGGDNSVQIRKLWGRSTSTWEWVCFGRPVS